MLFLYFQNRFCLLVPLLSLKQYLQRGEEKGECKRFTFPISALVWTDLTEVLPVQGSGSLTGGFTNINSCCSAQNQPLPWPEGHQCPWDLYRWMEKNVRVTEGGHKCQRKRGAVKDLSPLQHHFRDCGCGSAEQRRASHPCNNLLIPRIAYKGDICGGQRMKSVDWKTKNWTHPKPSFCSDHISLNDTTLSSY